MKTEKTTTYILELNEVTEMLANWISMQGGDLKGKTLTIAPIEHEERHGERNTPLIRFNGLEIKVVERG